MGWWKTDNGVIGDSPADLCDKFLDEIEALYQREMDRLPTQGEIADVVEFCTCGILKVACGDAKYPFSAETVHGDNTPRAAERGGKGALADVAQPPGGGLANVDPTTGEHF